MTDHQSWKSSSNLSPLQQGDGPPRFQRIKHGTKFCVVLAASSFILNRTHKAQYFSRVIAMQGSVEGGFAGRTHKLVDGCYTFWQGALFPLLQRLQPLISQQQGLPLQIPPVTGIKVCAQPSLSGGQQPIFDRLQPSSASSPSTEGANQHDPSSSSWPLHEGAISSSYPVQPVGSSRLQQPGDNEATPEFKAEGRKMHGGPVGDAGFADGGPGPAADEVWLPDVPDVEVQTPEQQARAKMSAAKVNYILLSLHPSKHVCKDTHQQIMTHIARRQSTMSGWVIAVADSVISHLNVFTVTSMTRFPQRCLVLHMP